MPEGSDKGHLENASHVHPEEGLGLCHERDRAPRHGLLSTWFEKADVKAQGDCIYVGKVKSGKGFQKMGSWLCV